MKKRAAFCAIFIVENDKKNILKTLKLVGTVREKYKE